VAQLACEDHMDDDTKNKNLRKVGVQVKNLNSVDITRLALVHKYSAVGPELLSYEKGINVGEATVAQAERNHDNEFLGAAAGYKRFVDDGVARR